MSGTPTITREPVFAAARWVGVTPISGNLGLVLDAGGERHRYRVPAGDAQRLLEDLFSLLVVGKADVALVEDPYEVRR